MKRKKKKKTTKRVKIKTMLTANNSPQTGNTHRAKSNKIIPSMQMSKKKSQPKEELKSDTPH